MASEDGGSSLEVIQSTNSNTEYKHCWVCFLTDEDEPEKAWIRPCKCRGSTKWVHLECLSRWIQEKFVSIGIMPHCMVCKTRYNIIFPKPGLLLWALDCIDSIVTGVTPIATCTVVASSLYISFFVWGSCTIMQVVGLEGFMEFIQSRELFTSLFLVPLIPVGLLSVNGFIRLTEDYALKGLRVVGPKIPVLSRVLPIEIPGQATYEGPVVSEELNITRTFTGASLLPTFATFIGDNLFNAVDSPVKRALWGGLFFLTARSLFNMYLKQKMYRMNRSRRILSYGEEPLPSEQLSNLNRAITAATTQ